MLPHMAEPSFRMSSQAFTNDCSTRLRCRANTLAMKSPRLILLLGIVAVLCTSCSRQTVTASLQRDAEAISALRLDLDAATNARDAERVVGLFTTDAVYLEPDAREVVGRSALTAVLQKAYGQSTSAPEGRRTAQEVKVAGEWAFEWGRLEAVRPALGPSDTLINGKYLHVYQRQADGTWKIARASYNANPPEKGRLAVK